MHIGCGYVLITKVEHQSKKNAAKKYSRLDFDDRRAVLGSKCAGL
jgi:hypothetical protein